MLKRDAAVLLLAALAILSSLQHSGPVVFRAAWHFDDLSDPLGDGNDQSLPQPIVFDLNGDGTKEVIVATEDARLLVLDQPPPIDRSATQWPQPTIVAEASLSPTRVRISRNRRAVAIAAGYLDAPQPVGAPRRKGVMVVVTASWSVLVFDHNLKLLWENSLAKSLPPRTKIREVAVLVTNHSMRAGDRGAVIVGGSLELGGFQDGTLDPLEEADQELRRSRRGAGTLLSPEDKAAELEEAPEGAEAELAPRRGVDRSHHFNYYAFEGRTGAARWSHDSSDFHLDTEALADQLVPQHQYKLDAASLAGRHFGEASCREYRESVLEVLPHRWTERGDTRFALAHFRKHRHRGAQAQAAEERAKAVRPKALGHAPDKVQKAIGKVVGAAGLSAAASADPQHTHAHALPPNVIVAHLRDGIEAIHLYTGRTVCKLLLPTPELHVDINADGVIDHVSAVGQHVDGHQATAEHAHTCWASVRSGLPPREHLFNGTICRTFAAQRIGSNGQFYQPEVAHTGADVLVAPPAILPRVSPDRPGIWRRTMHDTVFLNNRGDVTSYAPNGFRRFQVRVDARWSSLPQGGHPTLLPLLLRRGGHAEALLVAGVEAATLLSPMGSRLTEFPIPSPPVASFEAVDFDGDGLTDLLLRTHKGVYAWRQVARPGALPFMFLMGFLILSAGLAFVLSQQSAVYGPAKRSTDME